MSAVRKRLSIAHEGEREVKLDFIRAHVERLPYETQLVHGFPPAIDGRLVLSGSKPARAVRRLNRIIRRRPWEYEITEAYRRAFTRFGADAVLAEWGPVAVRTMAACDLAGIPLIAHFHGYDVAMYRVLQEYKDSYAELFQRARALVGVSRLMVRRLVELGAPPDKVHYNPYGVDLAFFKPGPAAIRPPVFVTVGRFVEKKAPQLTIEAFARALPAVPDARLIMVGDGPLLGASQTLARGIGVGHAIEFAGAGNRAQILERLSSARAFLQHSIVASDGDSEGTPVAILEAGAMALPVVSTRHAGIPDVVVEGETGFLVDELDVAGMSAKIEVLARNGERAAEMGAAARRHIEQGFSIQHCLDRLTAIIDDAMRSPTR